MNRHFCTTLVVAVIAGSAAVVGQQVANPPANESPKQLIIKFFGFQGTREERSSQTQTVDYVQHNPRFLRMDEITGARGNQAWVKAQEEAQRRGVQLVALNGIGLRNPVILYEAFAFESFRMRDGKMSEHWDQVRLTPGWMTPRPPAAPAGNRGAGAGAAGRGQQPAPPPDPPAGCSATAATIGLNLLIVNQYYVQPATDAGMRTRAGLVADDYVEHNPRLVKFNRDNNVRGRDGLMRAFEGGIAPAPRSPLVDRTLVRDHVVAECDYVSVVWKQVLPDPDDATRTWEAFTFDAFRLRDGKIAEHWDSDVR